MINQTTLRAVWQRYTPITWICLAYLFFSHIPRTAAMVNTLTGILVLATGYLFFKHELQIPWRSPIVKSLLALVAILVVGVAVSPYWRESIVYLRREILPMTLMILLLISQKREANNLRAVGQGVVAILLTIYVARTLLAAFNWATQGFQYDSYTINRAAAPFVDFYAVDSTLLMPIALACCLYWPMRVGMRVGLGLVVVLGIVLVGLSAVRTALLCTLLITGLQLLPFLWRRKILALGLVVVTLALGVTVFKPQVERLAPRYLSIFNQQTYQQDYAVVERYAIWRATYEMIQARPVLGYGLGWQKMTQIVHQDGFYERWKNSPDELMNTWATRYFVNGPGGENPHNLVLQILFETGILGLISYLWLLGVIGSYAWYAWCRRKLDADLNAYAQMVLPYAAAYGLINITNGFWLMAGSTIGLLVAGYLLTRSAQSSTRNV